MTGIETSRHNLLFSVRRSNRYHMSRTRFFDRLNKWITFICALSGTAVFATIIGGLGPRWSLTAAAVVAVSSVFDLVVSTSQRARIHTDLARRFIQLEQKILNLESPTEKDFNRLTVERLSIEADEPPVNHVLNCICHNELVRAMGYPDPEKHYVPISTAQRFFAQLFDLGGHKLSSNCNV